MEGMSVQKVQDLTGFSAHTLRYYEKAGLMIHPVGRAANGHRRYSEDDVYWLRFVHRLRQTAMPIADIPRYAELARQGESTVHQRLALLESHRDAVRARLQQTTEFLGSIERKIDHYRDYYRQELTETKVA